MRITDTELKKLLLSAGQIKEDALTAAMPAEGSGETLLTSVIKHKLVSEKELTKMFGASIEVPFIELSDVKIPREILLKIPERIARKYQAVLFGMEEDQLQLAMADPEDFQAADFITKQVGGKLRLYIATASVFQRPGRDVRVRDRVLCNLRCRDRTVRGLPDVGRGFVRRFGSGLGVPLRGTGEPRGRVR